jgi:predicted nucleotidyltransferase
MGREYPLLPRLSDDLRSREKNGLAGLRLKLFDRSFNESHEIPIARRPIDLHPFGSKQTPAAAS